MIEVEPQLIRRLRIAATTIAAAVMVIALASLSGWAAGIETLKSVVPGLATMKVNTALSLLLCGAALIVRTRWPRAYGAAAGDVLSAAALALPVLTLLQWSFKLDLHIDQFLVADLRPPPHGFPGRMSVATATCLTMMAASILLLDRLTRLAQGLAIACMAAALLGMLGYAYGIAALYRIFAYSSMALHTAGALALLSIAHLMSRPRRCLHQLLISRTLGGRLSRRVLPATVVVPLVVGWFCLQGFRTGWYDYEFGLALFALVNIIILASIVWINAMLLDVSLLKQLRAEKDRDEMLVREQAARARVEKALSARDQLLSVVSHELRTPLTPVLLMAASIEHRAQLPADVQEDVRMIREQIELEAHLIDGLLDLTSLQQGKITIERHLVDLNDVARRAVALFGRLTESHGVELRSELDPQGARVLGDRGRLQQVAANLFSNAIKFTPRGGTITLRTYTHGNQACFEISDSGVGIAAEAMERIFGPFEQADASTTRRFGGLGIGLAISQKLIELHDGRIAAASDGLDKGSTFTVALPLANQEPAPVQHAPEAAPRTILLVDDNRMTVKALQRTLQGHGHQILTAVSARQAIDLALNQQVDLIISDIGLPDLSGWEMMRQLRQQFEIRGRRPIRGIAISGFVDNDDRQKSLESGFVAHLAKPIDVNVLIETVNGALGSGQPVSPGSAMASTR